MVASGRKTLEQIEFISPQELLREGIEMSIRRNVTSVDVKNQVVETESGESIAYDKLLVATGGSSRFPPIKGLAGKRVFSLMSADDATNILTASGSVRDALVIGAGLIGCEAAAALTEAGLRVSLVEIAGRPLPLQLDATTGAMCADLLARNGVEVWCNESVGEVSRDGDGNPVEVKLASGRVIAAGMIVCATGIASNVSMLDGTGIRRNKGIVIGKHCETSIENVYAAGDVSETEDVVARRITASATWPAAVKQGSVAGANMAGVVTSLERNTGLKTAFSIFGTHAVSIGQVNPEPSWTRRFYSGRDTRGMMFVKVLLFDAVALRGAILWGDVSNGGLYLEAIVNRRDLRHDIEYLDRLDAAKRGVEELLVS
jgi:NAD(P)H-nitrite reductase large subunit